MSDKRFQECSRLEKIWRYRHYTNIPFRWIRWRISGHDQDFNGLTYWKILIGIAQSEMRWYYTEEELDCMVKRYLSDEEE